MALADQVGNLFLVALADQVGNFFSGGLVLEIVAEGLVALCLAGPVQETVVY